MLQKEIYRSRKKATALTLAGFVMGLAGGLVFIYTTENLLGWCLTIAALFILILGISSFFDRKPQIILTERGITEPYSIREEIEWDAIISVDDLFFRGQNFVRLVVGREYKPALLQPGWFWRLDRMYERGGLKAMYIKVSNLDVNSMQLAGFIARMVKATPAGREKLLGQLSAK